MENIWETAKYDMEDGVYWLQKESGQTGIYTHANNERVENRSGKDASVRATS